MDEPLALEWAAYRAACDAIDLLLANPVFGDPYADPTRRRHAADRLLARRRSAVAASRRLIAGAEQEPDLDPGWLDELREEHELLLRALASSERQAGDSAISA